MADNAVWRCDFEAGKNKWSKHLCDFHYRGIDKYNMSFMFKLYVVDPIPCDRCLENEKKQLGVSGPNP